MSISPEDKIKNELLLKPLNSPEELQNWMFIYLDILFPMGTVYPDSTHGPIEAMWRIYELMKTGESEDIPQVSMLASRDSYKTLGASAIEVLCMLHFRISIAHMAAISSQSEKAIQYVNNFFRRLKPYLEANGWKNISDNKKMVRWLTDEGEDVYLRIVIATIAGANCLDQDTIVETKRGFIPAIEVQKGDYLKSFDFWENKSIWVEVTSIGEVLSETREFVFEDDSNLISSVKHKVFTQKGWVNAGNIKINDRVISTGDYHTEVKPSLTKELLKWNLESLIYGTLLGDASIQKLPSDSCRYQVFHCKEQLPYLEQIQKTFLDNGIEAKIIPDKDGFKLYTQTHDIFKEAHSICYKNFKRKITEKWMSKIDLQSIAFLIMDDGTTHRKTIGKYKESPIDIAVLNFTDEEIIALINKIKELGYNSFKHTLGKYSQIRIPIEESRNLTYDISSYFVDCLKYKLCFSDSIRFAIDSGNSIDRYSGNFIWEDRKIQNRKKGRSFRKQIKQQLNKKVKKINHLGVQRLVGIGVNPLLNFNLKNFYANGILVHNSEHVPMLFIDEVDVVQDPRALNEAKMIPSTYKNYFPLTVYLSTRKFAGGLMEKTLKQTLQAGGEILRWNILDVTERISRKDARADEPKVTRYLSTQLPMENLTPEEWKALPDEKKHKYEKFEAYAGIIEHPLLPVMRNYLVDRPQDNVGYLYKPISAVRNNFNQLDAEMAEAQLLCNKPSSSGLVYPRFDEKENVLTPQEAWERISGLDTPCTFNSLRQYLIDLGVTFIGGADWGFSDLTSLVVLALLPNGEIWHVDTFAMGGLEIDDIAKYGKELQDTWFVDRWYCDQNYPSYLKTLRRKANMKCPKFTKDVSAGISSLQSKIVNSTNVRKYFVIDTPNNKQVIDAYGEYRWKTDAKGEIVEGVPLHGNDGTSDIMDSIRYPFQNLFAKGAKAQFGVAGAERQDKQKAVNQAVSLQEVAKAVNQDIINQKITQLTGGNGATNVKKKNGKKKILW